ncbi:MAG: hypothetical protein U1E45_14980 [Geminicoccaceae bacterium]
MRKHDWQIRSWGRVVKLFKYYLYVAGAVATINTAIDFPAHAASARTLALAAGVILFSGSVALWKHLAARRERASMQMTDIRETLEHLTRDRDRIRKSIEVLDQVVLPIQESLVPEIRDAMPIEQRVMAALDDRIEDIARMLGLDRKGLCEELKPIERRTHVATEPGREREIKVLRHKLAEVDRMLHAKEAELRTKLAPSKVTS